MAKSYIYVFLSLLLIAATFYVMYIKIVPFNCCSCPAVGYKFGFITWIIYLNNVIAPHIGCANCANMSCALTTFTIPIEPTLLSVVFGLLSLKSYKKR